MKYIRKKIKQLFCSHIYMNGIINPFIDEHNNHSAIYTCEKCGRKKFVSFER